jgi:hypothetical protein
MSRAILQDIIDDFEPEKFTKFFRDKNRLFAPRKESFDRYNDRSFSSGLKIGEIPYSKSEKLLVCAFRAVQPLSERSGKKAQYDKGKKILRDTQSDAGIFIFYDKAGNFRLSLIYANYLGKRRDWSIFRRFTYFVSKEYANKTFLLQLGPSDFSSADKVKDAFSLAKVTNNFYDEFNKNFSILVDAVLSRNEQKGGDEIKDFALLFAIRVIFLGFIQKRGWLGDDEKFMQNFFTEYSQLGGKRDQFYPRWLRPLFFEALNTPPGRKVAYRSNDFPLHIEKALQMAPFLNGGLFEEHDLDKEGYVIPDDAVIKFFDFLFSYNFTIEENTLYDEELELNPEFLGIIFERLVNKEDGAIYTPRTEVDFMCRMALVKWLEKNNTTKITLKDLYELFFLEGGPDATEDQQRRGDFTTEQKKELITLLSSVAVCDPAVGSGAFLVGMLHVLEQAESDLRSRVRDPNYKLDIFRRKERIIASSLYGVEVKQWAVWITQLRLWITLFIDAPEDMRSSLEPILPCLDFKVRQGDSLVQRIGKKMFPVTGHANISSAIKAKITKLKELKNDYYQNKAHDPWRVRQAEYRVFLDILDAEITSKRQELRTLGEGPRQMDFLGESEQDVQKKELFQERIGRLKEEIVELQDERNNLGSPEQRPLVWNIEFSEIFFEKGGFDIVIGNPPYVRQEDIADPLEKIKNAKDYKNALAEMVTGDFQREFRKEKVNAQSDLYAYFYIRSLRLLHAKGIHVFICSNSWLDVGYGVWLQKFFLNYAPVHFIFDNHAKRSFAAADVNTIIGVIGAPMKRVADDHMIKFVAFKLPFEEVIFTENILEIERARTVEANEKFRVYPITDEELFKTGLEADEHVPAISVNGKYVGDKWGGKFLRAPDIFFSILEKGKGKLVRLEKIADVRFGIKTGANEFFYLDDASIKQWRIEKEFLRPVIKSPRECKSILVDSKDLQFRAFICSKTKAQLKGTNALKYIQAGEKAEIMLRQGSGKGTKVKGYQNLESIKGRKHWWQIGEQRGNIFWVKEVNDRLAVFLSKAKISADCRLYYAEVEEKVALYCNSTLYGFFSEVMTRAGLGLGARSLMVFEVQKSLILHNGIALRTADFKDLLSRAVRSVFEECGLNPEKNLRGQAPRPLPDRKKLDDTVFDLIGLTPAERKEVYWSVCELVKNRLDKARSI